MDHSWPPSLPPTSLATARCHKSQRAGTLHALKALRAEVIDPKIAEHRGRIFKTTGDGVLVEFSSVVNAVSCAVDIQKAMLGRNGDLPEEKQIQLRIGVNLGDIIVEGEDIFGDGVNVAARLEGIASTGGILVAGVVREQIGNRLNIQFEDLGEQQLKNIERAIRVFQILPWYRPGKRTTKACTPRQTVDRRSSVHQFDH